jgi:hypothetical protein
MERVAEVSIMILRGRIVVAEQPAVAASITTGTRAGSLAGFASRSGRSRLRRHGNCSSVTAKQDVIMAGEEFTWIPKRLLSVASYPRIWVSAVVTSSDCAAGSSTTPDGRWSVDMAVDASVVVSDTKLIRHRRDGVCSGETNTTRGFERNG